MSQMHYKWQAIVLVFCALTARSRENLGQASEPMLPPEVLALPNGAHPPSYTDDRAVVVHAARAIILAVPTNWQVREMPWAREVRLAMAPGLPDTASELRDGMWLAYHHQSRVPTEADELRVFAMDRFQSIAPTDAEMVTTPTIVTVDERIAVRLGFDLRTSKGNHHGFFLLVAAPWGHCELQAMSPDQHWSRRESEFARIVDSLQLRPPKVLELPMTDQVRDAKPILGSWKSFRGRLRLWGDGRVSIVTDRPFEYTSDDGETHQGHEVTGRFEARGDLLMIVWDDNSKLNFRWRRQINRLLLTDHEGRTTQLRSILE